MPERAFTTIHGDSCAKLAFDWQFDQRDLRRLEVARSFLSSEEYQRQKDQFESRTTENLKSEIRERFCTVEYQTNYIFENGKLINPHHDEPFTQIIQRGITYRRQNGSIDQVREQAELIGFERIEKIFSDADAPKTVVSISPRGNSRSVYKHNFFDVFQGQTGSQIKMTRFTSTASLEDFQLAAQKLNAATPRPFAASDAYFLAHPIETTVTLDEILKTIELDNNAMEKELAESIIEICMPLILAYVHNPGEITYKAAVNLADILAGKKQLSDPVILKLIENPLPYTSYHIPATLYHLASLPVRQVATGCGISGLKNNEGSFSSRNVLNPWSVADFAVGEDEYGTLEIHCEECGTTYQRTSGKLEKNCRKCGGTKGITC